MDVNHDKLKDFFLKETYVISNHARVITVYVPEKDKWIDYRIRRDKS